MVCATAVDDDIHHVFRLASSLKMDVVWRLNTISSVLNRRTLSMTNAIDQSALGSPEYFLWLKMRGSYNTGWSTVKRPDWRSWNTPKPHSLNWDFDFYKIIMNSGHNSAEEYKFSWDLIHNRCQDPGKTIYFPKSGGVVPTRGTFGNNYLQQKSLILTHRACSCSLAV